MDPDNWDPHAVTSSAQWLRATKWKDFIKFSAPVDVAFLSACYEYILLPFFNKETTSAYSRAEYNQTGKAIYRVGGVREMPCSFWRKQTPAHY